MRSTIKNRIAAAAIDLILLTAGMSAVLIVGATRIVPDSFYSSTVSSLTMIDLCFLGLISVIEIVSAFTISDSTWHTAFMATAIFLFYLTCSDMTVMLISHGFNAPVRLMNALNFACFVSISLSMITFWNYTYKMRIARKILAVLAIGGSACVAIFAVGESRGLEVIAYGVFFAMLLPALVTSYRRLYRGGGPDMAFFATEAMFFAFSGLALADFTCAAADLPHVGTTAFYGIAIVLVFFTVYVSFAARTDRKALRTGEYKLRYERIKARALKEQIKPHFVFNVLATIQSLYRRSPEDGDRAITLLSRHLRTNIEAADTDLIPFEKELENIQVYVDLENMRLDKKFDVVFDIDYLDFEVPALALQPYVENAIKHSRANEKEDGRIIIGSRSDGNGGAVVTVDDNGEGFDPAAVGPTSCGLRNSRERLAMLLGSNPTVSSSPGHGTRVTIEISASHPALPFGAGTEIDKL